VAVCYSQMSMTMSRSSPPPYTRHLWLKGWKLGHQFSRCQPMILTWGWMGRY